MITVSELGEIICLVCPHCRVGQQPAQTNGEWVHTITNGDRVSHTICWANGLRNSRFAKEAKNGG